PLALATSPSHASPMPSWPLLSSSCYACHPDLHSFPTRRSSDLAADASRRPVRGELGSDDGLRSHAEGGDAGRAHAQRGHRADRPDRKSTRLNSSHVKISYAVFCLKKKNKKATTHSTASRPWITG